MRKALLERLERRRRVPGKRRLLAEINEIAAHCAALPVLDDRGPDALRDLDLLLAKAGIALVPVDVDQAHVARQAHRLFGRGSHAAQLNFGDCFSYAPAQASGEPLLYKGGDFSLTDVLRHPASVQA